MRNLVIGGIEIPIRASEVITQSFEPIQSVSRLRMSDGALTQQTSWSGKLLTKISADGILPSGLQLLDYSQPIVIKSIAESAVLSASNIIDVPSARRGDYSVEGRALVDGKWVSTPVNVVGDTATLTVVASATQYQAIYWAELSCYCDPPTENRNARNSTYSWDFEGEEI